MEITFARLNKLGIFEVETMSFINDMIHYLVSTPEFFMNSGWIPSNPAAFPGFRDIKAVSSSSKVKFFDKVWLTVNVLFFLRRFIFVVPTCSRSLWVLETRNSRDAMSLVHSNYFLH
jgi:hypothetical protein